MFRKAKRMVFPREVIAGHNVIEQISDICNRLDVISPGVIVTGKKTRKIAGEYVAEILEDAKYECHIVDVGNPTKENITIVTEVVKETNSNFLIGVGGGSKIDIAKISAKEMSIPFISVPTSVSHDGIASPRASIRGGISVDGVAPLGIVADTSIIVKAPYRTLASGCADVISNITAVKDWLLAYKLRNEPYSSSASMLAEMSAYAIIDNANAIKPNVEESAWIVIKSVIESGAAMCIADSSRPCSGSEHMFSHMLDILAPDKAMHGEQCGVGTIMMMYLHNGDWEKIKDTLKMIGAPTTAKELGIEKEIIIESLTKAHKIRKDRYTILGDSGLSVSAAERLCEVTGVI